MILITLGSREYQFNRLLKAIDELKGNNKITEEIFAQIGQSDYEPKYFKYQRYLSKEEFNRFQQEASLIISHAGTGALVSALKLEKQVIAVPRLKKYNEHIDDHQLQVAEVLEKEGYLMVVKDMDQLEPTINKLKVNPITKIYDRPSYIHDMIVEYIELDMKDRRI